MTIYGQPRFWLSRSRANANTRRLGVLNCDARAELLASSTMAVFSPLCVASGRVPRAIQWLIAAGFEVPYVRVLQLRRGQVEGLWEHLIPRLPQRRVDVVIEALTAGPSALVALRRPPNGASAAEHLSEIKGSADPSLRNEQTLRSHLGAPNLLTSLVHTPDSAEDLLRELRVLLPHHGELEDFWRAQQTGAGLDDHSLPSLLSGDDPPPSIDALVVGMRIQARLFARLAEGASATSARDLSQLAAEVLRDLQAVESEPSKSPGALARHRAEFESRQDRLRRAVADHASLGSRAVHRQICLAHQQFASIVDGDPFDLDLLIAVLEGSGVAVDVWERIVLASEWVAPSPRRPRVTPPDEARPPGCRQPAEQPAQVTAEAIHR